MTANEFGIRLRLERQRLGMTQTQLGIACGQIKNCAMPIWRWENGLQQPTLTSLNKLREAGVDTHYVLTGERTRKRRVLTTPST